jgi:hypothetical protein
MYVGYDLAKALRRGGAKQADDCLDTTNSYKDQGGSGTRSAAIGATTIRPPGAVNEALEGMHIHYFVDVSNPEESSYSKNE